MQILFGHWARLFVEDWAAGSAGAVERSDLFCAEPAEFHMEEEEEGHVVAPRLPFTLMVTLVSG